MNTQRTIAVLLWGCLLSLLIASSAWASDYKAKEKVRVLWNDAWFEATIVEVKDDKYKVHYKGWEAKWDEWVTPDRITPNYKAGDTVEVDWKKSWYKATIKAVKDGKFHIHYEGHADSWDEWVGPKRIRPVSP